MSQDDPYISIERATVFALAYFFDLVTLNNSLKGVWIEQVKVFRRRFDSNAAVVEQARAWLDQCESFRSPRSVPNGRMYGGRDATATAALWRKALAEGSPAFDDAQIDLLVQALLRAQQSVGSDPPRGFPGIYQADVLMRGGTMALGLGVVHGRVISGFP